MLDQRARAAAAAAFGADPSAGPPVGDGPADPRASAGASDEALMGRLAAGQPAALEPLYRRHARGIYALAAPTLGPAAAEELVQEVFLAVWRKAATFDPQRGTFRAWVLQVAHLRILNELRRRSHRPRLAPDPEGLRLAAVPDGDPEPAEATWRAYRRAAVRAAVAALPPAQRRALGLAFFEELTHEQVAAVLGLPLGTAKTRIRAALQKLRHQLAPVLAALLVAAAVPLGVRVQQEAARAQQYDRALRLVTTSDVAPVRLTPAPGVPEAAHGTYRGRPGAPIAVLTFSNLPPAPAGRSYQAWVHHANGWTSLGRVRPDAQGSARLIVEGAALAGAARRRAADARGRGRGARPERPRRRAVAGRLRSPTSRPRRRRRWRAWAGGVGGGGPVNEASGVLPPPDQIDKRLGKEDQRCDSPSGWTPPAPPRRGRRPVARPRGARVVMGATARLLVIDDRDRSRALGSDTRRRARRRARHETATRSAGRDGRAAAARSGR